MLFRNGVYSKYQGISINNRFESVDSPIQFHLEAKSRFHSGFFAYLIMETVVWVKGLRDANKTQ